MNAGRAALRAGYAASALTLGGRRTEVKRPRVRGRDGHELTLPSWREWSARDPLIERAVEQMVLGVSTRGYARSLEPLPERMTVRGVSRSAVSDRFVYGTERSQRGNDNPDCQDNELSWFDWENYIAPL